MGVDVETYRMRIGLFSMPRRCKRKLDMIVIPRVTLKLTLRLTLILSLLLLMGGDVESNPGPPRQAKQKTLTFADAVSSPTLTPPQQRQRRNDGNKTVQDNEIMSFLREMKGEMKDDMKSLNNKMDNIETTINNLRAENEQLKKENSEIKDEINKLSSKLDTLESYSRRNNLRIYGLEESERENWDETEQRVRLFLKETMDMPEHENVEIERAHRVGSKFAGKRPIIVKLSKYKDKEAILGKARRTFQQDSDYSVKEDFTERVQRQRRELGKYMMQERAKGRYARLKYDKLIVDTDIFKFDDSINRIVRIGKNKGHQQPIALGRENDQYDVGVSDQSDSDNVGETGAVGGAI